MVSSLIILGWTFFPLFLDTGYGSAADRSPEIFWGLIVDLRDLDDGMVFLYLEFLPVVLPVF